MAVSQRTLRQDHDALARSVADASRRIDNLTRWGRPHADDFKANILKSIEAKHAGEVIALAALAAQLPPAPSRLDVRPSGEISFPKRTWQPLGTIVIDSDLGDIPACLQRRPA